MGKSPKSQARGAVSQKLALNTPRHGNNSDGKIHSLGTARSYTQALTGYAKFIRESNGGSLFRAGTKPEMAMSYLQHRAELWSSLVFRKQSQTMALLSSLSVNEVTDSPSLN